MKFKSFLRFFGMHRLESAFSSKRRKKTRRDAPRSRFRVGVEGLEERTLMSVLPAPYVDPAAANHVDISPAPANRSINNSSASIAVDPTNSLNQVSVWVQNDPAGPQTQKVYIDASTSIDGGKTWNSIFINGLSGDPTTNKVYVQMTDPSVGFDRSGNFYVVYSEHDAGYVEGTIEFQQFSFSGGAANAGNSQVIYGWGNSIDQAFTPSLAVDSNLASFTDPDTGLTQTDSAAGTVYVSWVTNDSAPAAPNNVGFNPNAIRIVASHDGGASFSSPNYANQFANFGSPEHLASPRLVVSQGTADGRIAGGQVTVVWDDFGSGAMSTPPFDTISAASIAAGLGAQFSGNGGPIPDAVDPGNSLPHITGVANFSVVVNIADPTFLTVSDLDVTLGLTHPTLDQVSIDLIPPAASGLGTISLLVNRLDNAGNSRAPAGITGANLGIVNKNYVGTTFDDEAARNIIDTAASAPYTGHYQSESGGLQFVNGLTAAQINGTWTLRIGDHRKDNNPVQSLTSWQLNFTSGLTVNSNSTVASYNGISFPIRGALPTGNYPLLPPASPDKGIGPAPTIASDNTLGSFSPFQGRLYVTYAEHFRDLNAAGNADLNPAANTDIAMAFSDDGGFNWTPIAGASGLGIVNDDMALTDGFSGSSIDPATGIPWSGRSQFLPEVAVDQTTGTVVVTYLDARQDASNARVANTIATSVDGGNSFGPQSFLNLPDAPTDEVKFGQQITTTTIGPLPENSSTGNANRDTTFGFGTQNGLAVAGGHVYANWASNENGLGAGNRNGSNLDIQMASGIIAVGPRVVSSTEGPVESTQAVATETLLSDGATPVTYNDTFAADGTRLANGFVVQFDRPVDPATISTAPLNAFRVAFRNTVTPVGVPGITLPVTSVIPVVDPNSVLGLGQQQQFGASRFVVLFDPTLALTAGGTYVGTYSYSVGPNVRDRVRSVQNLLAGGSTQTFNAVAPQVPRRIPPVGNSGNTNSTINVVGAGTTLTNVTVNVNLTYPDDRDLTLILIPPSGFGSAVFLSFNEPFFFGPPFSNFTNTTFDDAAALPIFFGTPPFTGSFQPETPLSALNGTNPNGAWRLQIQDPQATSGTGTLLSWSITITSGTPTVVTQAGNYMDQNADTITQENPATASSPSDMYAVPQPINQDATLGSLPFPLNNGAPFTAPYDPTSLPIIVPGPHILPTNQTISQVIDGVPVPKFYGVTVPDIYDAPASSVNLSIPPVGSGGSGVLAQDQLLSRLVVSGATGTINDLQVNVSLIHPNDGDLQLALVFNPASGAPSITVPLATNRGGNGANFTNTFFGDSATVPISAGSAPFNNPALGYGYFQPEVSLMASLSGLNPNGVWQLQVTDTASGNVGTLVNWSLVLSTTTTNVPPVPTNTADHVTLNNTVRAIDVTFDRDIDPSTFGADKIVRLVGGTTGLIGPNRQYDSLDVGKPIPDGPQAVPFTSVLNVPDSFNLADLNVQLNITHPLDGDLSVTLIAPDGTQVNLFSNVGGVGQNFTQTYFDDSASTPIQTGVAPFASNFRPANPLSAFNGKNAKGVWKLQIDDSTLNGQAGTLISWSLFVTPVFTITPNPAGTPAGLSQRVFRIEFPVQQQSGTYTLTLGADIRDTSGNQIDANLNAGVDILRGAGVAVPTVPVIYNATQVPVLIPDAGGVASSIVIPDNYLIGGITLQLDITHPNDPDLSAILISPDGVQHRLFTNIGTTGTHANFFQTVFDDTAQTFISNGGPPFSGKYAPQDPLAVLNGTPSMGTWTLVLKDNKAGNVGKLNSWSLTLLKPLLSTGLGEPIADQSSASFRIFTMDPANPLSHNTFTAVGPASENSGGNSGRIGGLAVDPSDPSGNTVYVAGASGAVWKTSNFLTQDANGPTYVPLTNYGPTYAVNVGSIAVFGRNGDPNQSIVFVATGEGDTGTNGVGFLRSTNGGADWQVLDSTTNVDAVGNPLPINSPLRDHKFVGSTSFKVVVDPKPSVNGTVIVYAALSGANGGVWRSLDSGNHWQLMRAGNATDVVLDPNSGYVDTISNPTGNLQFVYAAFRSDGVYFSQNRGVNFIKMLGTTQDPLIQETSGARPTSVPVIELNNPNGAKGRIILAKPALTGQPLQDLIYQGWLYAAVVTAGSHLDGVYMTKDFGQNWTQIAIPAVNPDPMNPAALFPSNDTANANYDPLADPTGTFGGQGNYDVSFVVDPTNPNLVYLGGTTDGPPYGFLRIDTTGLSDPHALFPASDRSDGGQLITVVNGVIDPIGIRSNTDFSTTGTGPAGPVFAANPLVTPWMNFIRNELSPFDGSSTLYVRNTRRQGFVNTGAGAKWIPFGPGLGGTDQHELIAMKDPLTGLTRMIFGDDQGVWTGISDPSGQAFAGLTGSTSNPVTGSRNGNLQIIQFYQGASQPSFLGAQIAGALFYGQAQDDGFPASDPNILSNGNLTWVGPAGDGTGVGTDQQGKGTLYQYNWPCCGGAGTDFFQVNGVGRTFGLLQAPNDPQWPFLGGFNLAVNPLSGDQLLVGSNAGRLFESLNQGRTWVPIADPADFDGNIIPAIAYGAPDPNDPNGGDTLNDFIYAGTLGGHIYVSYTSGRPWTDISNGLDTSPVYSISTNPQRGSFEAYAVTATGVFHMANSKAYNPANPATWWQNITSNVFNLTNTVFGNQGNLTGLLSGIPGSGLRGFLEALAVDWRYVIPDQPNQPPTANEFITHPVVYVAGQTGVYRSLDDGKSWEIFPNVNDDPVNKGVPSNGGLLPNVEFTKLDLALGNINPTTGRPLVSSGPDVLLATSYGEGSFGIRLAPVVLTSVVPITLDLTMHGGAAGLVPGTSDSFPIVGGLQWDVPPAATDSITNVTQPAFDGFSEQSAFGNTVTLEIVDLTPGDPFEQQVIGTGVTDTFGHFIAAVDQAHAFTTDGVKIVGIRGKDAAGAQGNYATFTFTVDLTPPAVPAAPDLIDADDSGLSNTDNITNVTKPSFSGTVYSNAALLIPEPNAVVQLYVDGVATNNIVVADALGNYTIQDTTALLDGAHLIQVQATDIANNTQVTLSPGLTIFIDTMPPARPPAPNLLNADDSGQSNVDHITNVTTPHFFGTAEAGSTVQLFVNGAARLPTTTADLAGNYTDQLATAFTDGVYMITATATDIAGNISPQSLSMIPLLVIDTTPPSAPSIPDLIPVDDTGTSNSDNVTNINNPHFQGTAEANAKVTIYVNGVATTVAMANAAGAYLIQIPSQVDGTYTIQAQQTDVAGNTGPISGAMTPFLVIDQGVPAPPPAPDLIAADDSGHSNTDNITNVVRPRFQGTAEPFATVTIFAQSPPGPAGGPPAPVAVGSAAANGAGNYLVQVVAALAQGTYSIYAQQADAAGNVGPLSAALTPVVIDTTAPAAPSTPDLVTADDTGLSNIDDITFVTQPHFSGTAEPNSWVQIYVNGVARDMVFADNAGNYLVQLSTALANGTFTITARSTDTAGNSGPFSAALVPSVIVDTVAPVAPTVPDMLNADDSGNSNTDNITNVSVPRFQGSAEPNAQVNLFINGVSRGQVIADSVGHYQVQIASALADGTYTVTAGQTDVAGNSSPLSAAMSPSLVIDSTALAPNQPALLPIDDTGLSNSDNITFIKIPHFTGVVEPGSLVSLFAAGVALPIGTAFADASGNYSVQVGQYVSTPPVGSLSSLADGTYTITVQQKDKAGNVSPMSAPVSPSLIIDSVKPASPTVPDLIPTDDTGVSNTDNITRIRSPHFQGTSEAGAFVQIFANNVLRGTGFADNSGNYLVQVDPVNSLIDGTYAITAQQTDIAGNVSVRTAAMVPSLIISTFPVAPSVPDLLTADDSGVSNTDNITRNRTPHFTGTGADSGNTILILANGVVVGQGTADASGDWSVQVNASSALGDGTYAVTAKQVDPLARTSAASPALSPVIIDGTALAPANVNLLPADDTGVSNSDHNTKVRTPHITGTAEPNALVTLFVNGVAADTGLAAVGSGAFNVQLSSPLADGTYTIQASQQDIAGNTSSLSAAMSPLLVIDTRPAITGQVFNDLNGNATQDGGDVGLSGWTVFLDGNGNGTLDNGEASTLSDGNGNYNFHVSPGTYTVREVVQAGWTKTTSDPLPVNVTASDVVAGKFGNFMLVSISGRAFTDANGDGSQTGDLGLNGVRVELYKDVTGDGILNAGDTLQTFTSTATVAGQDGSYSFAGVGPGQYLVHEVVPSGSVLTAPAVPGDYALATSSGSNLTGRDFGNFALFNVAGRVFTDQNGDGSVTGDPGRNGVTVDLYRDNNQNGVVDVSDTLIAAAITANVAGQDGSYAFPNVGPGHYLIHQALTAGLLQTVPASGVDLAFAALSGTNVLGQNFADFVAATISGQVFQDINGDGVQSGTDGGLPSWNLQLLDANNNVVQTVSTNGAGNFTFTNVGPGVYHIREVAQGGWLQTTANPADVTINASGMTISNVTFGNFHLITVSGRVYNDLNANGTDDLGSDPGIAGQRIELYRDVNGNGVLDPGVDTLVAFVNTPATGLFSFSNVGPGQYILHQVHLNGAGIHQITPPTTTSYTFTASSGIDLAGQNFGDLTNPNRSYVYQVYIDLLGRPVDLGGLNYWSGILDAGGSRTGVVAGIQGSLEYLQRTVNLVFQAYLGRQADPGGMSFGISVLTNQAILTPGASALDQLKATILGSPEYFAIHGNDNSSFVQALFLDVLKRPVDPGALTFFVGQLGKANSSRTLIAKQLLTTYEAKTVLVTSYYLALLHRLPDPGGLNFWANALLHGAREDDVIRQLVTLPEYYFDA